MPITPPAGRECRDASQLGGEGRGASTRGEDALGTVSRRLLASFQPRVLKSRAPWAQRRQDPRWPWLHPGPPTPQHPWRRQGLPTAEAACPGPTSACCSWGHPASRALTLPRGAGPGTSLCPGRWASGCPGACTPAGLLWGLPVLKPLSSVCPPPPAVPCPGSWHESTRPSSLGQLLEKRDCYPILPTRAGSRRVPPGSAWAEDSPWRSGPWSPVPPRSPQGGISQAARAGPGLRKKGRPLASPGSVLGRRLSLRLMGDNVLLGPASCTGLHGAQLPDTLLSA